MELDRPQTVHQTHAEINQKITYYFSSLKKHICQVEFDIEHSYGEVDSSPKSRYRKRVKILLKLVDEFG